MKKKGNYLAMLLATVGLIGCSQEETKLDQAEQFKNRAGMTITMPALSPKTYAAPILTGESGAETDDVIVFFMNVDGSYLSNITFKRGEGTPAGGKLWQYTIPNEILPAADGQVDAFIIEKPADYDVITDENLLSAGTAAKTALLAWENTYPAIRKAPFVLAGSKTGYRIDDIANPGRLDAILKRNVIRIDFEAGAGHNESTITQATITNAPTTTTLFGDALTNNLQPTVTLPVEEFSNQGKTIYMSPATLGGENVDIQLTLEREDGELATTTISHRTPIAYPANTRIIYRYEWSNRELTVNLEVIDWDEDSAFEASVENETALLTANGLNLSDAGYTTNEKYVNLTYSGKKPLSENGTEITYQGWGKCTAYRSTPGTYTVAGKTITWEEKDEDPAGYTQKYIYNTEGTKFWISEEKIKLFAYDGDYNKIVEDCWPEHAPIPLGWHMINLTELQELLQHFNDNPESTTDIADEPQWWNDAHSGYIRIAYIDIVAQNSYSKTKSLAWDANMITATGGNSSSDYIPMENWRGTGVDKTFVTFGNYTARYPEVYRRLVIVKD